VAAAPESGSPDRLAGGLLQWASCRNIGLLKKEIQLSESREKGPGSPGPFSFAALTAAACSAGRSYSAGPGSAAGRTGCPAGVAAGRTAGRIWVDPAASAADRVGPTTDDPKIGPTGRSGYSPYAKSS